MGPVNAIDDLAREVAALRSDSASSTLPATFRAVLQRMGVDTPSFRRVLVVDDEVGNLDVIEALLETEYDVVRASSGLEALRLLAATGPADVVLSDQRMPGMSGVRFLSQLAIESPETIRIILTAYTDVEPIVDAVNRGSVYRFLIKPWDPEALRTAVREGIELKTRRQLLQNLMDSLEQRRQSQATIQVALERARDQLLAAERFAQLGRITSGVTHDINNQLGAMLSLADVLREPGQSSALREAAESAIDTLESLLVLVQDVNAFAKHRDIQVSAVNVQIESFFRETLSIFALERTGGGPVLAVEVDDQHREWHFDPSRVRQALLALIRNAVQASPSGARVVIAARLEGDEPVLEVRDQGSGMSTDVLARAHEPFYSAFSPPGLGLGLGIADLVARAHSGSVRLDSAPGVGTVAQLRFGSVNRSNPSGTGMSADR